MNRQDKQKFVKQKQKERHLTTAAGSFRKAMVCQCETWIEYEVNNNQGHKSYKRSSEKSQKCFFQKGHRNSNNSHLWSQE